MWPSIIQVPISRTTQISKQYKKNMEAVSRFGSWDWFYSKSHKSQQSRKRGRGRVAPHSWHRRRRPTLTVCYVVHESEWKIGIVDSQCFLRPPWRAAGESSPLAAVPAIPTAGQQQPAQPPASIASDMAGSFPSPVSQKACAKNQLWIGRKDSKVPRTFLIAHFVVTVVLMLPFWMHGCFSFSHPHPNKHILLSVWVTVYAQVIKSTVVQAKELSDIKQTEYQEHGCSGMLGRLSGEQKYPFPVVACFFFPTTLPSKGIRHGGRLPRHVQWLWLFHIVHVAHGQVCWCSQG